MSINHVVLTGKCAEPGPKLIYNATSAKPECRLTLIVEDGKGDGGFSLYVPVFVYGSGGFASKVGFAPALFTFITSKTVNFELIFDF